MKKIAAILLTLGLLAGCTPGTTGTTAGSSSAGTTATTEGTKATTTAAEEKLKADIVVIGAGGAGMTAAIQAVQNGATNVVILEKMPMTGGNTVRSTGGLNASETKYQKAEGIEDSNQLFFDDTMKGGKNLNNPDLVHTLVDNSAAAVDWVNEIGGDLSVVGMFGGASVKRIHRPSDTGAVGPMLVKALNAKVAELKIPVLLETEAKEILADKDGKVTGVKIKSKGKENTIECKTVVIATGGFGANSEMVVKYKPDFKGFGTTNHAGATGDGIVMAEALGAATVDMDQIQNHPTVDPETQTLYTEGVRGNGAILVNKEGKRFVNELDTRDVVSTAILAQTDGKAYMVFDEDVRKSLKAIESYFKQGLVKEGATPEELAKAIGIDAAALTETMKNYSGFQAAGKDTEFNRPQMEFPLSTPKFYAVVCSPAIHHTMGGLVINNKAEVINKEGKAITGLFAAGEVTGGIHGANRLGGNAVADIIVFGRIAGTGAEAFVKANGGNTPATIKAESNEGTAIPEVKGNYKDGTYTGKGTGKGGDIEVEIKVTDSSVTSITVTKNSETPEIFKTAETKVINQVIKTQKAEADAVAGATLSVDGLLKAISEALSKAK
ncbi:MAG: flavocytochrome c [Clostridiaceae bacterium]